MLVSNELLVWMLRFKCFLLLLPSWENLSKTTTFHSTDTQVYKHHGNLIKNKDTLTFLRLTKAI